MLDTTRSIRRENAVPVATGRITMNVTATLLSHDASVGCVGDSTSRNGGAVG